MDAGSTFRVYCTAGDMLACGESGCRDLRMVSVVNKCLTCPIDMVTDGWADTEESNSISRVDGNEMGWESRFIGMAVIFAGGGHLRRPLPTGPGPYQGRHWSQKPWFTEVIVSDLSGPRN